MKQSVFRTLRKRQAIVAQELSRSFGRNAPLKSYSTIQRPPPASSLQTPWVLAGAAILGTAAFAFTTNELPNNVSKDFDKRTQSTLPLDAMPRVTYDTSEENMKAAKAELIELLGLACVDDSVAVCISHSSTAWSEAPRGDLDRPGLVVYPTNTPDVSNIAKICHRRRIPMIGFSGGTSLEGSLAATRGGICIDFKAMKEIQKLNSQDLDVIVQPGVDYMELNQKLAKEGLYFPPDPGPGAKIGGMISQSCSGTNAYRYGTMKDWVLGLTVVLADGTIVKTRHRPRKSNCGYDLTRLMIGSEGTLGLITEATLKLTSLPQNERVAVAAFPNTHKAVETVVKIVQNDMPLACMELLCEVSMRAANLGGYCSKEFEETPTLFLKFAGTESLVRDQIETVKRFAKNANCKTFEISKTKEEADAIWSARKTMLWSTLALKNDPSDEFLSADTAVPISRLADAIEMAKMKIEESGLLGSCLGHVGDGNFHTSVLYPAKDKEKAQEVITSVQRQAIEMGGTVTGEHGVGFHFRDMVGEELGEDAVDMMRQIKLALDPLCLLNPDKVFRSKIDEQ